MVPFRPVVAARACAMAVAILAAPLLANAKDLCIQDNFNSEYVFRKVKSLKKPGQTSPLTGIYLSSQGGAYAVAGTALVRADLSIRVGIMIHATSAPTGNSFLADWSADQTLAGTGTYDSDGDFQDDGAITFTAIECSSLTIP